MDTRGGFERAQIIIDGRIIYLFAIVAIISRHRSNDLHYTSSVRVKVIYTVRAEPLLSDWLRHLSVRDFVYFVFGLSLNFARSANKLFDDKL